MMKFEVFSNISKQRLFSIYGAMFGSLFPIVGTIAYSYTQNSSIIESQKSSALLWIIDTAPIVLAIFSSFAGKSQDNIISINKSLDSKVKQRTKDLEGAKRDLESAYEAKSIFLANISHELRTPLNAIIGYAQALDKDSSMSHNNKDLVHTIEKSGSHLLGLINDILDLSKAEAGLNEILYVDFDLCNLVNDISEMFRLTAKQKKIEFICNKESDFSGEHCWVSSDANKVKQILINLLGNSIKFSPASSTLQMNVTELDEYRFLFEIIDQGAGISPMALQNIFKAFVQADAGKKSGGTGLGLSISSSFVNLLGGKLQVESIQGKGSKFYFELTFRPSAHSKVEKTNKEEARVLLEQKNLIKLPEVALQKDFTSKILTACELYNVTDLKKHIEELSNFGTPEKELAIVLKSYLETYDIESIKSTLTEVNKRAS